MEDIFHLFIEVLGNLMSKCLVTGKGDYWVAVNLSHLFHRWW